jgi:hypothetical protein
VTRVAAAIEGAGGGCELPELLSFALQVGRTLPRVEKPVEMPVPTPELERELEESDKALAADPKNPAQAQRFGRASLELAVEFDGANELRARFRQVLVCTSLATHRSHPLPDDLRTAMQRYLRVA